jgi:hypothetical protein
MTTTTILNQDSAAIVEDDRPAFEWGAVLAGGMVAAAATFFLVVVGAALGLSLAGTRNLSGMHTFLTLGAIYFLAAQAFGFGLGGHITGRLMRPAPESEDEHFRADVHGLAAWSLALGVGLLFVALVGAAGIGPAARQTTPAAYWTDKLLAGGAPATAQPDGPTPLMPAMPAMTGQPMPSYADRQAQAGRLLAVDTARNSPETNPRMNDDRRQLIALVGAQTGMGQAAAETRVEASESGLRADAEAARKTALYLAMWTAFALLFGGFVSVAATVMARFHSEDFRLRRG